MTKPPVTMQQRLGFQDTDLRKPGHDQMMQWLGKTSRTMLPTWLACEIPWRVEEAARLRSKARVALAKRIEELKRKIEAIEKKDERSSSYLLQQLQTIKLSDESHNKRLLSALLELEAIDLTPPNYPPVPEMTGVPEWEHPLNTARQGGKPNIIGFADMLVRFRLPRMELGLGDLADNLFTNWLESGDPLTKPSFIGWKSCNAYFEVKTEIPSLGELMRQLQFYRSYLDGYWFVVSPDTQFKDTLAEQGIRFIEYRPTVNDLKVRD